MTQGFLHLLCLCCPLDFLICLFLLPAVFKHHMIRGNQKEQCDCFVTATILLSLLQLELLWFLLKGEHIELFFSFCLFPLLYSSLPPTSSPIHMQVPPTVKWRKTKHNACLEKLWCSVMLKEEGCLKCIVKNINRYKIHHCLSIIPCRSIIGFTLMSCICPLAKIMCVLSCVETPQGRPSFTLNMQRGWCRCKDGTLSY